MTDAPDALDTWAIIEAMGHRTAIGRVCEATIAGKQLLKVDRLDGAVQYYPPESLYCLTPCSEEQARAAQKRVYGSGLPFALAELTSGSTWADDVPEENALHHEVAVGAFPDIDEDDIEEIGDPY